MEVKQGITPQQREVIELRDKAMSGDIVLNVLRADVTPSPTSSVWTYTVKCSVETAAGEIHDWYSGELGAAAADTSTAGTAAVDDSTPSCVNGIATVVLSGDAATWADTETATCTFSSSDILGVNPSDAVFTVTFTA